MYHMPKAAPTHYNAATLDEQYNNRLRVPDFMTRHVQPWQHSSQQVRASQAAVQAVQTVKALTASRCWYLSTEATGAV
jgi:hypothetical protein